MASTGNGDSQFVVFMLEGEEFGITIEKVREIIRMTNITRLPNTAGFIEGVINLRGEVIPIVNLRKRLGANEKELTGETRIVNVELNGGQVGLIVDSVSEVLRLQSDSIEPAPSNVEGLKTEFIEGVGRIDDRLLVLLKVEKLLTTEEKIALEEVRVDS